MNAIKRIKAKISEIRVDQVTMSEKKKDDKKNEVTEEFVKSVGNKIRRRELGAQLKKQKKKVRTSSIRKK